MHVLSRSVYPSIDLTSEVVYNLALIMYCNISGFFSFPGFIPFFLVVNCSSVAMKPQA